MTTAEVRNPTRALLGDPVRRKPRADEEGRSRLPAKPRSESEIPFVSPARTGACAAETTECKYFRESPFHRASP